MKFSSIALAFAFVSLLLSCSPQRGEHEKESLTVTHHDQDAASSEVSNHELAEQEKELQLKSALSSNAAVVNTKDTVHQFVRTAEMKCLVNNVVESTHAFERIVAQYNGFVTYTHLHSNVNSFREIPIGVDSILSSSTYTVVNNISLRVPNIHLDTVLKSFAQYIEYFDYRIIKADDVALQLMGNRLSYNRNINSADRMQQALLQQKAKLNEITTMEESIHDKQAQADAAYLQNVALKDKIAYSTVTIELYQPKTVMQQLRLTEEHLGKYEPSLASKIIHALSFGWHIFESIVLFILKLWPLAMLGLIAYVAVKKYGK
ncbi:MAG TPA: DUF4349 domain-containing protein [Bacteroidia bacterium]|nr:DUF4349 domain-containing protein [Bacteroidia bacterium]